MKGLTIGQQASVIRVFTVADVEAYRTLTGDVGLGFGSGLDADAVPGPLLAGMFSDLMGTKLPGRGTNWLKQRLQFSTVARIGEEITAVVQISRLRPAKQLVNLETCCLNAANRTLCEGEALVLVSDLEIDSS